MTSNNCPEEDIEVCKETKCPLRKWYALAMLTGNIANFHDVFRVFKKCKDCTGYGFYQDKQVKRGIECVEYPFLIEAREWVREQNEQRRAQFAVARTAAGD